MSDFDFDYQPSVNKRQLLDLSSLHFMERQENILFIGSSGVGKTHLATAIVWKLVVNESAPILLRVMN